jgi:hypothetical protein
VIVGVFIMGVFTVGVVLRRGVPLNALLGLDRDNLKKLKRRPGCILLVRISLDTKPSLEAQT